jgi:hypothetical protein
MGQRISIPPYDAKLAAIARLDATIGLVKQIGVNEFEIVPFGSFSIPNEDVVYINDPNVEGLTPLDPTKPCTAYSKDGTLAFYGWNTDLQIWN